MVSVCNTPYVCKEVCITFSMLSMCVYIYIYRWRWGGGGLRTKYFYALKSLNALVVMDQHYARNNSNYLNQISEN